MTRYRTALPQLIGNLFLTDGGIETTLIFHDGLELPDFAAFHLLQSTAGRDALLKYFRSYAEIAKRYGTGIILESATWRASADWGTRLGYTPQELADANRASIALLEQIRREYQSEATAVVISGCVGPRGDGYIADRAMTAQQAEHYHRTQIETFAGTTADMVCAITMNCVEEAIGIARAAERAAVPVVLSFTVETDGRLPTGQSLRTAIEQVDESTGGYPRYYMINCAHPSHLEGSVSDEGRWLGRLRGLRANASRKSHAELNESIELDVGDPVELGRDYARLRRSLKHLNVMGGCCGTDHRHIEQIASTCLPLFGAATT
jgi:S-methylmethionine-dependent homocysteine/selenocysteine methylase